MDLGIARVAHACRKDSKPVVIIAGAADAVDAAELVFALLVTGAFDAEADAAADIAAVDAAALVVTLVAFSGR